MYAEKAKLETPNTYDISSASLEFFDSDIFKGTSVDVVVMEEEVNSNLFSVAITVAVCINCIQAVSIDSTEQNLGRKRLGWMSFVSVQLVRSPIFLLG